MRAGARRGACDPVVQVTTYGRPGDPFLWVRESYELRGDVLLVTREIMPLRPAPGFEIAGEVVA